MKALNTRTKLMTIVALVAIGTVCAIVRVRAQSGTQFVAAVQFGILGITRGQTARINVTNTSSPDNPFYPPNPCHVTISFVDADGNVLLNNSGQPVRREVTLDPGRSASLQINGDNLVPRDQVRLTFRPVVNAVPPPCIPTFEVINNTTGRTSLLSNGTALTAVPTSTTPQ
jgi:hypothetical protein